MLIDHVLLDMKEREVVSIRSEATVREALTLLVEHKIGSLPVLDSSGKLIGIFTERDVLIGECGDTKRFHRQFITEVMTPDPVSCSTNDTVHEAMDRMSRHNVGHLPVVDEERLVGIVSIPDLIKSLYSQAETEKEHLLTYLHGPRFDDTTGGNQDSESQTPPPSSTTVDQSSLERISGREV
jgi:CBS domain-containing protein